MTHGLSRDDRRPAARPLNPQRPPGGGELRWPRGPTLAAGASRWRCPAASTVRNETVRLRGRVGSGPGRARADDRRAGIADTLAPGARRPPARSSSRRCGTRGAAEREGAGRVARDRRCARRAEWIPATSVGHGSRAAMGRAMRGGRPPRAALGRRVTVRPSRRARQHAGLAPCASPPGGGRTPRGCSSSSVSSPRSGLFHGIAR